MAAIGDGRVRPRAACRAWPVSGVTAVAMIAACARPAAPPGGEPDRAPPGVVRTSPETMSVVEPWDGDVVIRFDERLSERAPRDVLQVSPPTGRAELDRASWGSELRVSVDGGWRAGRVYRIVLRPGLQDRFGNVREEPVEVVFSTGPEIPASAVAGVVRDRMTGRPVPDARVEARSPTDTLPLLARSDTTGSFVIPHLPPGEYRVQAYSDDNLSGSPEPFEPVDTANARLAADGDTARVALALLLPDSTPARLASAEPIDSTHVRVGFDDAFDPERPLDGARARLWRLPDSTAVPVEELVHMHAFEERRRLADAALRAGAADSLAADSLAADSLAVDSLAADTAVARRRPPAADAPAVDAPAVGAPPADSVPQEPLPARELVLILARALEPAAEYGVEITGVTNISGVAGGGGTATFRAPEPPPPDTTAAPADTAGGVPPDTTGRGHGR